jgi:hypothetical protein
MISVYGLSLASKIEILGYPRKSPYGFSVISAQLFDYFNIGSSVISISPFGYDNGFK